MKKYTNKILVIAGAVITAGGVIFIILAKTALPF
jgi:hypothetical protein